MRLKTTNKGIISLTPGFYFQFLPDGKLGVVPEVVKPEYLFG